MPRSPSPPYRGGRYRDSPPRRHPREQDRDWNRDRDRDRDRDGDRSWGGYNRPRDFHPRDNRDSRDRPRGRDWDDGYRDRDRDDLHDRSRPRRSPSPPPPRPIPRSPVPVKSRAVSGSEVGAGSASPEEGQITSPVRSSGTRPTPVPVPIPFYRDRIADRRDRDDYDRRPGYGSRYPSGPSRRSRSPSPRDYPPRRRSRSRSRSSYSYSTQTRSSPDKSQSPRRRAPSPPRDRDGPRDRDIRDAPPPPRERVPFPSMGRAPPSGPRSDRIPPAGPRALSGDYPSGPGTRNPYAGPIDSKPQITTRINPDLQARSSPFNPLSPAGAQSPIARVTTPAQEIENPYARPIGAMSTPGSAHTRLSWADRKGGQSVVSPAQARDYASPRGSVGSQRNDRMVQVKTEPSAPTLRSPQTFEEDLTPSVPIIKQDPEVLARMETEARIRAELPNVELWSTRPKWEMDLTAHYAHLADLQQTTLRAQSAARMAAATVADAEAERIAAGERRKVAEAQLMSGTMGMGVGILGSFGA